MNSNYYSTQQVQVPGSAPKFEITYTHCCKGANTKISYDPATNSAGGITILYDGVGPYVIIDCIECVGGKIQFVFTAPAPLNNISWQNLPFVFDAKQNCCPPAGGQQEVEVTLGTSAALAQLLFPFRIAQ